MKNYMERDKFFYVIPKLFKSWPYSSRYAIGMNLDDFKKLDAPQYRFKVKGKMYEINSWKAQQLGKAYKLPSGVMPYIIPLEEFEEVSV